MQWNEPPEIDEVRENFLELGKVNAAIRKLKRVIDRGSVSIKKEHPRKSYLIDEAMTDELDQLAELEARSIILTEQQKFFIFRKDMYTYGIRKG